MKRIIFLLLTAILLLFGNVIYADSGKDESLVKKIEAKVKIADFELNEKIGRVRFSVDCEFVNHSDTGIMEIEYLLYFWNEDGGLIDKITGVFNGQDTPIAVNSAVKHQRVGQIPGSNKPKTVTVEVVRVNTEEEMPPVYLPKPGDYLYQSLSNANLENIKDEMPIRVLMWIDHGGELSEGDITDPELIIRIVDALTGIRIAKETDISVTDNYNGFSMSFANDEFMTIRLNLMNLEYNVYGQEHIYELENFEPFWFLMNSLTTPSDVDFSGGS